MAQITELDLLKKFRDCGSLERLANSILEDWESDLPSLSQQRVYGLFLLRAGFRSQVLTHFERLLMIQAPIAWEVLAEAISSTEVKLTNDEAQSFQDGFRNDSQIIDFYRCQRVETWHPGFKKAAKNVEKLKEARFEEIRNSNIQKLAFFKSSGLLNDELNHRKKLQAMFPNEHELHPSSIEFQNRRARDILARSPKSDKTTIELPVLPASKEVVLLDTWLEDAKRYDALEDIAILFEFVEAPAWSIKILNEPNHTRSRDWLILELYLRAYKFIEALDYLDYLEQEYSADAETAFATNYARARAHWHLGNRELAIETLKSITEVRPNYRQAEILLQEWESN